MSLNRYQTHCITDKTKDENKTAINYGDSVLLNSSCPYQAIFLSLAMQLTTRMHAFVQQVLEHMCLWINFIFTVQSTKYFCSYVSFMRVWSHVHILQHFFLTFPNKFQGSFVKRTLPVTKYFLQYKTKALLSCYTKHSNYFTGIFFAICFSTMFQQFGITYNHPSSLYRELVIILA